MNQVVKYPITDSALRWLETVLSERFGHAWHLSRVEEGYHLQLMDGEGAIVFDTLCGGFTQARSDQPCARWDAEHQSWESVLGSSLPAPGVTQLPTPLIEKHDSDYIVHYDILGLTYWMLARVEEIGRTDLDNHQRFPSTSSHAYKHGYLERPIVDEWLHILGQVIQRMWPQLKLKQHPFSIKVSHDVDAPSRYGFASGTSLIRAIGGDILKRRDFWSALLAPKINLGTKQTLHPQDPYNTFDWIMDVSEQHGLTSAFYFICGGNAPQDADYQPEHPAISALMRRIHERGHEIGLHPSYNTYQDPQAIIAEAKRLKQVCAKERIKQEHWGGRMHYLRWEHPTTLYGWEQAGMSYDSTLSYADHPGFRCGTCFEYPAFDPVKQVTLNLRIRPLIAMECTIIAGKYLNFGYTDQAMKKFATLKKTCRKVNGIFTLLWHNCHYLQSQSKNFYKEIIIK